MVSLGRRSASPGDPPEAEPHSHILSYLYGIFIFIHSLILWLLSFFFYCSQVLLVY